jgi:uncharacterized protein (DUF934 family)
MLVEPARNGSGSRIVDDSFTTIADSEPVPALGAIIVSLKRFLAEKPALLTRRDPLGVQLETAESPEPLGPELPRLALVVLHVLYFKDGRAYSWARLLRTRLGYKGKIRASGHILKDQLAFYIRVGVDEFDLRQSLAMADVDAALNEITNVYQPSVDRRTTTRDLRTAHMPK